MAKVEDDKWPDGSSVDTGPWKQLGVWDGTYVGVVDHHLDQELDASYMNCETNAAGEE